ncbi:unnamed protein product [Mytilus edulis]|uniref:Methyltransferase domain-containing protein n=1 Tax=Mytilus edulis TaxID=6550 RepID=A0A8S3T5Y3_MYTED|nr:unnamed protein product [Mytilus edulis]
MAGSCNGYQHWIKYVVVVTILMTCLYVTLYQTGYINRTNIPTTFFIPEPKPINKTEPLPNKQTQLKYVAPTATLVPVVPVVESDWNETFPVYDDVPKNIYKTNWWMSAAFLEWDLKHRGIDYQCQDIKKVGNWWICIDEKYVIKKPCLVYSFGIANDFSFDDDMAEHGCEVHSFDPSMKRNDFTRPSSVRFHALGLSSYTDDKFLPRKDIYVHDNDTWTIMTLNLIKTALGHKERDIDVLKIDVEGHEWAVIENLFEDKIFTHVKQFMLEYHLFPDWPSKSDYSKLLRTYKKLHDIGYHKFVTAMHPCTHIPEQFNIQADVAYVNTKYITSRKKRRPLLKLKKRKRLNVGKF